MAMPCILTVHVPWSKRYTHRHYRFLVFLVFAVLLFFNAAARLLAAVLFCLEARCFWPLVAADFALFFSFRCHTSLFVIPIVASAGILLRVRFLFCVCLSSVATSSFLSFKSSGFLRLCLGPRRFGLCCRFTCFLVLIFSPLITPLFPIFLVFLLLLRCFPFLLNFFLTTFLTARVCAFFTAFCTFFCCCFFVGAFFPVCYSFLRSRLHGASPAVQLSIWLLWLP